jgi:hypothetical protein
MSIAFPQLTSRFRSVNATPVPPVHWPSAAVGLALAVLVVVGVSWLAAPYRTDRRVSPSDIRVAQAPVPPVVATMVPTPIPPPALVTPEPAPVAEKVKVALTNGLGVNMRLKAGERAQRIKTLPEGTVLEVVGADQSADGMVWRQVKDAAGATGWVSSKFVAKIQP